MRTPGSSIDWVSVAFADTKVGLAIVVTRPTGPFALWRTGDAGATWHRVRIS